MTENVYCISDIHNDYKNFVKMLSRIKFKDTDCMYILGDVFDRGEEAWELYQEIRKYPNLIFVKGNHDLWLSDYIYMKCMYGTSIPYRYSTYTQLKKHMGKREMLELADWIAAMPEQLCIEMNGKKILLAHGRTVPENEVHEDVYYLGRMDVDFQYLQYGLEDYISIIGHTPTAYIRKWVGDEQVSPWRIWCGRKKNVYCIDCGNGHRGDKGARLGCLRLNDWKEFYV